MADGKGETAGTAGVLVRRWRAAAGLTQQELATRAGVSVGAVRDLEQGRVTRPQPRILERLAGALGLGSGQRADLAAAAGMAGRSSRPGTGLRLRVLGTMGCWHGSTPVPLGPARQRAVVALLAVHPNTAVRREAIIDALWPGGPPGSAVAVVQSHVSRLRKILDGGLGARPGTAVLVSAGTSYRLDAGPDELDLLAFRQLAARARRAAVAGHLAAACHQFEQALELWEGEPLADLDVLAGHPAVAGLTALHASVITEYAQTASGAGLAGKVLPHLRALAEREPLNEHAHAHLMVCLAAIGQQARALRVYEDLRQRLDDQLGVRPGPELVGTHLRVLRQEIPVRAAAPGTRAESPVRVAEASDVAAARHMVPQQLPAAVRHFVGRGGELAELSRLLGPDHATGGTMVISAIGGTAGVGKTALAVHWAHQVADRFPDGQLYVNLHGFDRSGTPAPAGDVIGRFLDALGVPAARIPAAPEAREDMYRSVLAGKQILIVLDNARDAAQVRPLLPGGPGCLVVVTSRNQLTGLAAGEGAHLLPLDLLTEPEARELMTVRLGSERVTDEAHAVSELIGLCARLPLALSIVAARAAAHPRFPLAALVAELRDASGRLDALAAGEPASSVRTVISWSYQNLSHATARVFQLLSVHPGPDITIPAAASLAGLPRDQARAAVAELARSHLLAERVPGRFTWHDLLRSYAAEQARTCASDDERHAAAYRMLDHYVQTSLAISRMLDPTRDMIDLAAPQPGVRPETLDGYGQAWAWAVAEHQVLLAAVAAGASRGFDTHAWQISYLLEPFLYRRGLWHDMVIMQRTALSAVLRTSDGTWQAHAHRALGRGCALTGSFKEAQDHLSRAVEAFRRLSDRTGEARARIDTGIALRRQGRHSDALSQAEQALDLYRAAGHRAGQAGALNNIGFYQLCMGNYQQARARCQQALSAFREIGDQYGAAIASDSLGYAYYHLGVHAQAIACCQDALSVFRELGDQAGQADALFHLGDAYCATHDTQAAYRAWRAALSILADLRHPDAHCVRARLQHLDGTRSRPARQSRSRRSDTSTSGAGESGA
jgi:DNA-binding SARP family transcriptional activator/tetratricopeptide (TPR) repeat protein/DNA-binding XRE family transcriptional regulator